MSVYEFHSVIAMDCKYRYVYRREFATDDYGRRNIANTIDWHEYTSLYTIIDEDYKHSI